MRSKGNLLISSLKEFFQKEQSSGIVLMICAFIALVVSNSAINEFWFSLWNSKVGIESIGLKKDLLHWVNDGLMAIFFLLVGLEIKREMVEGELSSLKKAMLPVSAAVGGMLLPAIIYLIFNYNTSVASGWGIPMATDIAFALGVLSLLGKRVPFSLKIMLTALAIVDDLGAILVIAVFYSSNISIQNLLLAFATFACLLLINKVGIKSIAIYLLLGLFLWYFTLKSGVHATIAGVLLAFAIPLGRGREISSAEKLEHMLHKPVGFIIMPIFAIANTGFIIHSDILNIFSINASLGIILGLLIGKPLGIVVFSWLAIKTKLGGLPTSSSWQQLIGIGFLGGIGYTMSIFIALLAFNDLSLQSFSKAAILVASIASGIVGFLILNNSSTTNISFRK